MREWINSSTDLLMLMTPVLSGVTVSCVFIFAISYLTLKVLSCGQGRFFGLFLTVTGCYE